MMDNFEKHIRKNKALFDYHEADKSKIWATIDSQLNKSRPKTKIIRLWKNPLLKFAATIVIALGMFSIINILKSFGNSPENNAIVQELADIDMHYKGLVDYQVKLLDKNPSLSNKEKDEFLAFMDELDVEYDALKMELPKTLDTELILEAIVTNYKKRIELIENLLKQINNSKKQKEEENEVYSL